MKKNILLLINGFGIERAGSYNVYTPNLMPYMDKLTREKVFASIPNKYLDYKNAYRNFSIGIDDAITYTLIENNINNEEYKKNQLLKYIANELNVKKTKLHIVCYWDSERTLDQLGVYIKEIQSLCNNYIYLHIVLCQKSLNDYKEIEKGFTALNYLLGNKIKIGIVTGENNLNNVLATKDIVKSWITEFGEKWRDLSKKVDVLVQNKTAPCDTRPFAVNADYKIEENDQVLIFNYTNIDIGVLYKELQIQKFRPLNLDNIFMYSLFPVKCEKQIPFMYNFAVSSTYTLNTLKTIKAKCMVVDKKDNCPFINYYLTGLRNTVDDDLKYLPSDDGFIYDSNKVLEMIRNYNKELYIINYEIDSCNTLEELSDRLKKIDVVIGVLDAFVRQNNYGLFITSLYGIEKEMYNTRQELCKIDFSGRSPLIIDDNDISSSGYSVLEGSLFDVANSIYSNINKDYKVSGILRKKGKLFSFLYKKPKK